MKYFAINSREFLTTRNVGYYYAALYCVSDFIEDDQEPEMVYRLDLISHIKELVKQKPTKESVTDWYNCMYTFYAGQI